MRRLSWNAEGKTMANSCYTLLKDLGLPVAALALCIAGNAVQSMQVDGDDHYGLWKYCKAGADCVNYPTPSTNLKACQAFAILGALFAFLNVSASIFYYCADCFLESYLKIFMYSSWLTSFFSMLTFSVWASKVSGDSTGHYGPSFALFVTTFAIMLIWPFLKFVKFIESLPTD